MTIEHRITQLESIDLDSGQHDTFSEGHCAMEVVAWLAGEGHTDAPECASHVLRRYTIALNDRWTTPDRQRLKPYLPRMIGTSNDGKDLRRAYLAADWAVRTLLPLLLDRRGKTDQAQRLRDLPAITDTTTAQSARDAADAVYDAADADAYAADADAADADADYAYAAGAYAAAAYAYAAADSADSAAYAYAAAYAADAAAAAAAAGAAAAAADAYADAELREAIITSQLGLLDRIIDPAEVKQ